VTGGPVGAGDTAVTLLDRRASSSPGQVFVTDYDLATGERIELGNATTANWATKIANLLTLDWGLEAGDAVAVELPTHWQAIVTILGAWTAGLVVQSERAGAGGLVAGPAGVTGTATDALRPGAPRLATALLPLGRAFADELPAGWSDFALEVPPQPDLLALPVRVGAADIGWRTGRGATGRVEVDHGQLIAQGRSAAAAFGLAPGGRLLTDVATFDEVRASAVGALGSAGPGDPAENWTGLALALLAPLAMDGSVVLVRNTTARAGQPAPDPGRMESVAAQERVTCRVLASPQP
jgi:uncharacterized protein (TIGR03089 family)